MDSDTIKIFTFTNTDPIRTILLDEHDFPVYRIETPYSFGLRKDTTVYRRAGTYPDTHFEEMARIHRHHFHQSEIVYGGKILRVGDYLRKIGVIGQNRKSIAPDGKQYKWVLQMRGQKVLITNDFNETFIASFKEANFGIRKPKHAGCLQIFPSGQHMMDLIVVTFVYLEEKRKHNNGSAGGPA
ncbi:hypothetical protein JAAARDRAFT_126342 [Jaapia argillacea MUCL 33604]|uniref:DUF6593 domain-containing protein n=1 Tax=Jaapia argillacea MUCL 33604 TaxID=933084 RepID=A0A067Q0N4_9AGAM|nr:hypothetical protein JAAARDRAFT_126342 [Jaapia argillacea MUCL 33604]